MNAQLFLDIETIPAQRPDVLEEIRERCKADLDAALEAISPPANYKDPAKIAEWNSAVRPEKIQALTDAHESTIDAAYRKTGLDGAFGQIACVSFAYCNAEPMTVWKAAWDKPETEGRVLQLLDEAIEAAIPLRMQSACQVVGHNVSAFDLRFLVQRSIVRGIRPHPVIARAAEAKPWETDRLYDTMVKWAGVGGKVSLDKLCKALRLPGKGDIDGSMVWDYVKAGRIAEVADYCADDVRKVRDVYRRMTFANVAAPQFEDVPA